MAYSFILPILIISINSLLIQTALSASPLFSICSSTQNFTTNSLYERNLNKLLGDLYFKTPPTGFGFGSSGQYNDRAYGLSLCRGDVSTNDCKTCVVEASSQVTKICPNLKGAVIWYDNCYLKYSDVNFHGTIDNRNKFYMWNLNNVSTNAELFNQKTRELIGNLSTNASRTSKMYAHGETDIGIESKIYGMVQCSRDLSRDDCKKCLDGAVSELPSCCGGKQGGRVVGGSCNIRYEIYPFLN
ncbi:hypothetical protein ABFS82_08G114700 [Erythranthe guttata]|nr:PREDICTED: cysteine-rich repeat secretory protein 38-like [Erythranthe guttata]|eukprot:XP_012830483.1 PREDICTED: cysteine-rich repeat secretory protein 38-like [Erythranthe guttata]